MINVSDTSKYNVSSSVNGTVVMSSLTINNTQSSDVGTYTCQAENSISIDRSSGILTVNGKPASTYGLLFTMHQQCYRCC